MDSFTLGLPPWPILRAFSPNPLVRVSDRVESVVRLLATAVTLLAVAVAGAAATAVHDSHGTDNPVQTSAAVRPSAEQTGNSSVVNVPQPVTYGYGVDIPMNGDADQLDRPAPTISAEVHAAWVGLALWLCVAAAAATAVAATQAILDRVRYKAWQRAIDILVGDGAGHNSSQS